MIITQRRLWDFDALDTRDIKSLKTLKWYYLLDNIIFGNKNLFFTKALRDTQIEQNGL